MATDRISDEALLNALVDGELAPAEQAAAAARLRNDKGFARAYATLSKLKAVVAQQGEGADLPAIELPKDVRARRWLPYAAAACLAAVLSGGAMLALLPHAGDPARPTVAGLPVTPVTFAGDPVLPDLSRAGLQLSRTVVSTSSGVQSLIATYLGPRGCRLELRVSNAVASAAPERGTARKTWQVGNLIYELVAFGMPATRFSKVAALAERETRANRPSDEAEPLVQARIPRPPCVT